MFSNNRTPCHNVQFSLSSVSTRVYMYIYVRHYFLSSVCCIFSWMSFSLRTKLVRTTKVFFNVPAKNNLTHKVNIAWIAQSTRRERERTETRPTARERRLNKPRSSPPAVWLRAVAAAVIRRRRWRAAVSRATTPSGEIPRSYRDGHPIGVARVLTLTLCIKNVIFKVQGRLLFKTVGRCLINAGRFRP